MLGRILVDTDVFPEACEALALRVLNAARYKPEGNVLDVGYGTGESIILQLTHPSIPRPSHLTGITSLKSHFERSLRRVERLRSSVESFPKRPAVDLHCGDAVYRTSSVNHPLDPRSKLPPFTAILAIDCAYHFNGRSAFLRQSFARLAPGGRIALADIAFKPSTVTTRALASLLRFMPKCNMVSKAEYVQVMTDIGYVDVELEDLSEEVFPDFVRFLKGRGLGWKLFGMILERYYKDGARFVLIAGSKSRVT